MSLFESSMACNLKKGDRVVVLTPSDSCAPIRRVVPATVEFVCAGSILVKDTYGHDWLADRNNVFQSFNQFLETEKKDLIQVALDKLGEVRLVSCGRLKGAELSKMDFKYAILGGAATKWKPMDCTSLLEPPNGTGNSKASAIIIWSKNSK